MMNNTSAFHVAPRNQGQIIEVAYAACSSGHVVRQITDQSIALGRPGRVEHAVSKMLANDEGEYWHTIPEMWGSPLRDGAIRDSRKRTIVWKQECRCSECNTTGHSSTFTFNGKALCRECGPSEEDG